jgi:hypothetical protein
LGDAALGPEFNSFQFAIMAELTAWAYKARTNLVVVLHKPGRSA